MYYVLYQWIRDGSKAVVIVHECQDYAEAQSYCEKRLSTVSVYERISSPVSATSKAEAIAMGESGLYWLMP
jgi:hypothetical protein